MCGCGGANLADGDGREAGGSSLSSRCRGEISECGEALDFGETEGFGVTVTLCAVDGATEGVGFGVVDDGVGDAVVVVVVVVLFLKFQLKAEVFANAVSIVATVITSPPLKVLSVLFAGSVAVGGWPTGIGS